MAQGDQRPRHQRQSSKVPKLVGPHDDSNRDRSFERHKSTDDATIKYIKRTLCAYPTPLGSSVEALPTDIKSKPLDELLPPLTSSNEVDVQLYAIIAVILSHFVQSWYNRITPDNQFVEEVVQIIAHCTRGIEERLRHVDLEDLLLEELPALFISHVDAVRVALRACSDHRSPDDVRRIYHSIKPHTALTPLPDSQSTISEQLDNEVAWSQLLVSRILPLVLPPEDMQNPCLHVLVSEVFSELIVRNAICGKASQPWVLLEGVTKLLHVLRPNNNQESSADATSTINRLEQFGLLSSAKATDDQDLQSPQHARLDIIVQVFWTILQLAMTAWLLLRSFAIALMHGSSLPARQSRVAKLEEGDKVHISAVAPDNRPNPQHSILTGSEKRPVIAMKVWTCVSRLSSIDERMPWLWGFLSLLQWLLIHGPGGICKTNSVLDRLMSSKINALLFRPGLLPSVLQAIRSALFPDNALTAARVPPTSAEVVEMKRECAKTIIETIPNVVRNSYFGTKDQDLMRQDVEDTLDLFADSYINRHLIISAVELMIVRLFPELGRDSVEE